MAEPGEVSKQVPTEATKASIAPKSPENVSRGRALARALKERLGFGKPKQEGASSSIVEHTALRELAGETTASKVVSLADIRAIRDQYPDDKATRQRLLLELTNPGSQQTGEAAAQAEQGRPSPTTAANEHAQRQRGRVTEAWDKFTDKYLKPVLMVGAGTGAYFVSSAITNSSSGRDIGIGLLASSALIALGVANETRRANRDQAALDAKRNQEQTVTEQSVKAA